MITKKFFTVVLLSIFVFFVMGQSQAHASTADNMYGEAWSSDIGWISFSNCTSATSCSGSSYGVTMDSVSGVLSGQAWSSNVGWINFTNVTGCPASNCQPKVNLTTGVISGFGQAVQEGGWIALNAADLGQSGWNWTMNTTTGAVTGQAWGDMNFGWVVPDASLKIALSPTSMTGTLTPATSTCTIPLNGSSCTQTLTWTTTNPIGTSAVTSATGTPSPANGNNGSQVFTAPYNASGVSFYLYNNGTLLATAVVNTSCGTNTWNGTKCSSSTAPTSAPVVTISASPISGTAGTVNPSITWSATNSPTSCTASNDWTGSKPASGGPQAQGILNTAKTYVYTLTCTNAIGSGSNSATVVVSNPSHTITATAGSGGAIYPSGSTTVAYGGSQTYYITPNAGYDISTIKVDGTPITPIVGSYTFSNVTTNHTISATFISSINNPGSKPTQCTDGKDNNGDGTVDWNGGYINGVKVGADPTCTGPSDNTEGTVKIKVQEL
ncbi:MAG: hypothetical protein KGI58_00015 [Patescibacteria group bacterium]|nr:hypothetical protein [Patescibacteria group bacterium]